MTPGLILLILFAGFMAALIYFPEELLKLLLALAWVVGIGYGVIAMVYAIFVSVVLPLF